MVEIDAVLDSGGVLRSCRASGHSGFAPTGSDIVCAAVSVLMRTAVRTLGERKGITLRCDAPQPGFLFLEADYAAEGKDFLFAAGVFLLEGLKSVAQEYPEHCTLSIRRT
jgi:uncharacterized protein YsxB (DUF464 family)